MRSDVELVWPFLVQPTKGRLNPKSLVDGRGFDVGDLGVEPAAAVEVDQGEDRAVIVLLRSVVEALKPVKNESRGSTEEVQRRAVRLLERGDLVVIAMNCLH